MAKIGSIYVALDVDVGRVSRFRDAANSIERDSGRIRTALGGTSRSAQTLQEALNKSFRMRMAGESLRTLTRTTDELTRLRAAFLGLSAITGTGFTTAFVGSYLLQTADKSRLLNNQLKTVTSSEEDLVAVRQKLFDISQKTRSSFDATVRIYARTARASQTLGLSQEKLVRITQTVQEAFAVGGATQEEARGAALQLSQAIASNRFSGDEFRSVAENAPVLLQGMAKALGVDIGKIRVMGQQGLLTSKIVTEAILKASGDIDSAFNKTTVTVGQGITRLDNAFLQYIGNVDQSYGVTRTLATALSNLSANFEEVAHWAGIALQAAGAVFGGRMLSNFTRNRISSVQQTRKARQEEVNGYREEIQLIQQRQSEIAKEKTLVEARAKAGQTGLEFDQLNKIHTAKEKEYEADQRVKALEQDRLAAAGRLESAQNSVVQKLQREVELNRELVRDAGNRVAAAQTAALEEERILRAKQAQKVAAANEVVGGRQAQVGVANGRVVAAAQNVVEARAAERAKLVAQIEERRSRLVTQSSALRDTQGKIAEMRSVQNLPDFEHAFGQEYRGLLRDQQAAMISTGKLRGEIADLNKQVEQIDAGQAVGRGLTSAMNRYENAVKKAQDSVAALTAAEKKRDEIASQPASGGRLDQRLAAEQREIAKYEDRVTKLKTSMEDLSKATTGAFDSAETRKYAADIAKLDDKIVASQMKLKAASEAVAQAQAGSTKEVAAAMKLRGEAIAEVNRLQEESNALTERGAALSQRMAAVQRAGTVSGMIGRAGSSVLGFLGGWTGVGFIAAIAGIGMYEEAAARAAAQTESIKKELKDLGYIAADASDGINSATKSLEDLTKDQLREKLRKLSNEMERLKTSQSLFGRLFNGGSNSDTLGNVIDDLNNQLFKLNENFRVNKNPGKQAQDDREAVQRMIEIAKLAEEGKTSSEDLKARLAEIGKLDLSHPVDMLIQRLRELIPYVEGLKKRMTDVQSTLGGAGYVPADRLAMYRERQQQAEDYTKTQDFLKTRETKLDVNDTQRALDQLTQTILKAARKAGAPLTPGEARIQATKEYETKLAGQGMLPLLGFSEGTDRGRGYNETLGYGKFTGGPVNLTSMTLDQVMALQTRMLQNPENTFHSSAVGRYQITRTTLQDLMGSLHISGNEFFTKEMQDRLAEELVRRSGGSIQKLRSTWTSLQDVPEQVIQAAFGKSLEGMSPNDTNVQKYIDGIKDLDLKTKVAQLDQFNQSIIQTAQSMGATNEELKQMATGLAAGDMTKIPDRFKPVVSDLQQQQDFGISKQLKEMQQTNAAAFLSDIDQKVVETARSFGIATPVIQQYIDALTKGDVNQIPAVMQRIQDAVEQSTQTEKLTKFADDVGNAFGGLITDALHGQNALRNFGERLTDIALKFLVIDPLVNSLKNSFRNLLNPGGGDGQSGGLLGFLFKGIGHLFGFDDGGYTGAGGKKEPAGIVHKGEYVFDAASVRKIGLGNLVGLHRSPSLDHASRVLAGYDSGGLVGMRLPAVQHHAPTKAPTGNQSTNFKIINVLDPKVVGDYLSTDPGERLVMNIVNRNK